MARLANRQVVARNSATHSENRIHADDVAQQYGFRGGLVPGVTVYAYATQLLVDAFGDAWSAGDGDGDGAATITEVKLVAPAYALETLTLAGESDGNEAHVEVRNAAGALLAPLHAQRLATAPAPDPRWRAGGAPRGAPRPLIHWDNVLPGTALPVQVLRPTATANGLLADHCADPAPLWRRGIRPPVHPLAIAQWTNLAFAANWRMPAWIHVGTRFVARGALRVGDVIEMRATVDERSERKGHQFARLYIAFVVDDAPVVEAWHTAIFRVAPRSSA